MNPLRHNFILSVRTLSFIILTSFTNLVIAQVVNTSAHPYDYGTGAEGAYVSPTGNSTLSGTHNYSSFTINTGDTVFVTGSTPLIIKCTGTVRINGVLYAAGGKGKDTGNGTPGIGGTVVGGNGGGVDGGLGGPPSTLGGYGVSYPGTAGGGRGGRAGDVNVGGGGGGAHSNIANGPGAGAGYTGGKGGANFDHDNDAQRYGDSLLTVVINGTNLMGGSGAGGGGGSTSSSHAGAGGGGGGGAFAISADSILLSGVLTVKGGRGGQMSSNISSWAGAGGGGSGGTILLQYKTFLTSSVVVNRTSPYVNAGFNVDISGALGGIYSTVGGNGCFGYYLAQKDTLLSCNAPTLTAKANNTITTLAICSGNALTLTANPTGGNGCTGTFEYSWSDGSNYWNGSGFASATPLFNASYSSISTTATSGVSFVVTARCSDNVICANSSSVTLTVAEPPQVTAISNNESKCPGTGMNFAATITGTPTLTYQWIKNGAVISGATENALYIASVTPGDEGIYNIIVTGGGACSSSTDSAANGTILTITTPPIAGTISALKDTVCSGALASLTLSGNSASDISWLSSLNNSSFSVISGATGTTYITGALSTDTYFKASVTGGGCSSTTSSKKIVASPAPTADYSFTAGSSCLEIHFTSDISGGGGVTWSFDDGSSDSHDLNPVHTFPKDTTYHVCLSTQASNNCTYTFCQQVNFLCTGTGDISIGGWEVYPSPFTDNITIKNSSGENADAIEVFDIMGRRVMYSALTGNDEVQLNPGELNKGVYYLKIKTRNGIYSKPIIKF